MQFYKNQFVDLAVYPTAEWKITSRQTSKIEDSEDHLYQTADDELPVYGNQLKRLFRLQLFQANNSEILDCEIELSILKGKSSGLPTAVKLEGTGKTFVGEQKVDSENNSVWQFTAAPFRDGYWLYLKIVVCRDVMRETALAAFRAIVFNASKPTFFLGEKFENAMASADGYPLFLAMPNAEPFQIYGNCTNSFLYCEEQSRLYFQIWSRSETGNLRTQAAEFSLKTGRSVLYKRAFAGLILHSFDNGIIAATESPLYNPNEILIGLKSEEISKTNFIELPPIISDL